MKKKFQKIANDYFEMKTLFVNLLEMKSLIEYRSIVKVRTFHFLLHTVGFCFLMAMCLYFCESKGKTRPYFFILF